MKRKRPNRVDSLSACIDKYCGTLWRVSTRKHDALDGRMIFAYIARKHINLTQADIATILNRCRSDVSNMQANAFVYVDKDKKFRRKLQVVERAYLKSQK